MRNFRLTLLLTSFTAVTFSQKIEISTLKRDQEYYKAPRLAGNIDDHIVGDCFYFDKNGEYDKTGVGQFQKTVEGVTINNGVIFFALPKYGYVGPGAGNLCFKPMEEKTEKKIKIELIGSSSERSKLGNYNRPKFGFVIPSQVNDFFIYVNEGNYHCIDNNMQIKWAVDLSMYGVVQYDVILEDKNIYILAETEDVLRIIKLNYEDGKQSKIEINKNSYKIDGGYIKSSLDNRKIYIGYTYGRSKYEFWKESNIYRGNGFGIIVIDRDNFTIENSFEQDYPPDYTGIYQDGEKGIMNAFVEDIVDIEDDLYIITSSYETHSDGYSDGATMGFIAAWKADAHGIELLGMFDRNKYESSGGSPRYSAKLVLQNGRVYLIFQSKYTPDEPKGKMKAWNILNLVELKENVNSDDIISWIDELYAVPFNKINVHNGIQLEDGSLFMLGATPNLGDYKQIISVKISFP
jgi:hypothetical protein